MNNVLETGSVLGMRLAATDYDTVIDRIKEWAKGRQSRYLCFATVHMIMEAYGDAAYKKTVNSADLTVPDGVPLVWALQLLGAKQATRVYGPDTTRLLLQKLAGTGLSVGFFGGAPETVARLEGWIKFHYPGLQVAYMYSPPFRPLSDEEDLAVIEDINTAGVDVLFVGLGCPKQERWMAEHRGKVNSVMLGVGAAFDFLAGNKPQAPRWMMRLGLEWLFRLVTEPRRLWRRYLKHNPRFVYLFARQLLQPSVVAEQ